MLIDWGPLLMGLGALVRILKVLARKYIGILGVRVSFKLFSSTFYYKIMKKVLPNYNKNAQVLYVHTVLFQFLDIRFWQDENKIHIPI